MPALEETRAANIRAKLARCPDMNAMGTQHCFDPWSGNQSAHADLSPTVQKTERSSMRLAKMVLAGSMLTVISSVALAQQALTGTVTTIDRISGTIAIQQAQSGTVGANTGGASEQFKVQDGMLNKLHAGDKVTFSVSEAGGTKTITKIDKQ
jgi:Cu/Ag efflux protein CusF